MISLDFSLPVLVIFLLCTLIVSFCSLTKRAISFGEHAVGYKQFDTATIVATIVACYLFIDVTNTNYHICF